MSTKKNYKKVPLNLKKELLRRLVGDINIGNYDKDMACEFLRIVSEFDDQWWKDEGSPYTIICLLENYFPILPKKLRELLLIKLSRSVSWDPYILMESELMESELMESELMESGSLGIAVVSPIGSGDYFWDLWYNLLNLS